METNSKEPLLCKVNQSIQTSPIRQPPKQQKMNEETCCDCCNGSDCSDLAWLCLICSIFKPQF
jgi:hypothetical protein